MDLLQYDPKVLTYSAEKRPGSIVEVDPQAPRAFDHYFAPDSKRWWRGEKCPRRDSFRQRSYEAESAFARSVERKTFANVAEVARYIREIMEKPFFQRRFPLFRECIVDYRPGTRSCRGGPRSYNTTIFPLPANVEVTVGHITMSVWGMRDRGEVAVLHELAHAVVPTYHRHDRRWARTFIELVGCAMGFTCKKILMDEFRKRRIPFSPVRKSNNTGEHLRRQKNVEEHTVATVL
jgi:putative metallohydrolase (TIGR04338 family)